MSKPVYMLVIAKGYTEAGHQLSKKEQKNLWAKVNAISKQAGEKQIISCNSRWADESIIGWAVFEYPEMDTYQKKVEELEKINWFCYVSTQTILGIKMEVE